MNEQVLRRHLHDLADSYGDTGRLRGEVRERLELLDRAPAISLGAREPAGAGGHRWLAAAAAVAVIGAGVLAVAALARDGGDATVADDSADSSLVAPTTPLEFPPEIIVVPDGDRRRVVTTTQPVVGFDVPADPALVIEPLSSVDRVAEFTIDSPDIADGHLAVVLPPAADVGSADEVLQWLGSTLSQAEVLAVEEVVVGSQPATRIVLASTDDMTVTGFRLGPQTFLSASGVQRAYEAYVVDRADLGVAVVWVDAVVAEIAAVRPVAELAVATLDWQP